MNEKEIQRRSILTRLEMETQLGYNEEEDWVEIYTASPRVKKKCEKMKLEQMCPPIINSGQEIAWQYKMPKKDFRWKKKYSLNLTDEERQNRTDRLLKCTRIGEDTPKQ